MTHKASENSRLLSFEVFMFKHRLRFQRAKNNMLNLGEMDHVSKKIYLENLFIYEAKAQSLYMPKHWTIKLL